MVAVGEPGAIVGEINDQCVFFQSETFERRHDLARAPVDFLTRIAIEAALGLAAEFVAHTQRHMRHRVRHIQEKRLGLVLLDEFDRPLGVPGRELIHVVRRDAILDRSVAINQRQRRKNARLFWMKGPLVVRE